MKSQFALVRARFGLRRALGRGILLALTTGLVAAPAASAVTYPVAGGNGFASGPEGWTSTVATCSPVALCTEQNSWSGTAGNPAGSLEARLDVFVNVGDIFQGQSTWRSPAFVATASGAGALRYDRQVETAGLETLNPGSSVEPVLVDETTNHAESLGTASLGAANSTFETRLASVPKGALTPGDRYHIEMRTTTATSTAQAGLTGSVSVRYDNVSLQVANQGPLGSSGSPGVTFTGPPLSDRQIAKRMRGFDWSANIGHLPGGSIVPRAECTIVGTPHADHIVGSTGNDVICGLGGNDTITGGGGRDIIDTGSGNDRVNASRGADAVAGLAGRDRLYGDAGNDRVGGGASADRLSGGPNRDRINGGPGLDRLVGPARHDRVTRVERRA